MRPRTALRSVTVVLHQGPMLSPARTSQQARRDDGRPFRMRPVSPASAASLARLGPEGLYDPTYEHDACGVALLATLTGEPSHAIVVQALTALVNLEHRGASGAEVDSGDGAGILVQ